MNEKSKRTMNDDFWNDYRFVLIPGLLVSQITPSVIDGTQQPYSEQHGGEKGIVFFPTLATAKAYKHHAGLEGYNITLLRESAAGLVEMSVDRWGCNVAYSIRLGDDGTFRRDVTVIVRDDVPDGSHRHGRSERRNQQ